jgi:hypothetical protein
MNTARWSRLAAWVVVILIPIRVLSLGFLPVDDALRHAGKALTDRTWQEILVMRPEATEDSHPGWHWILKQVHEVAGANAIDLVFFSVAGLFVLMAGTGLSRSNPTAWMLAMLIAYVTAPGEMGRWIMGRPYLVSSAVGLLLADRWSRQGPHGPKEWPFLAVLFSVVAWIHPSYYLFAVPVAALIVCSEFVGALVLGSAVATGAVVAGGLTGHPVRFLYQSFMHPVWSLSWPNSTLASEFQPANGAPMFLVAVLAIATFTRSGGGRVVGSRPLLAFAGIAWALGFVSSRFWTDWGLPVGLVLLARLLEEWIESSAAGATIQRGSVVVAAVLFLAATPDTGGRWSGRATSPYLVLTGKASAGLLPDDGGILYSDDMRVFYEVFFRKPNARFRFILGYEPGLMPLEDQNLLRIEVQTGLIKPFEVWVAKMTPKDRMVLRNPLTAPELAGLSWTRVGRELWVGQKELEKPGATTPAR